MYVFFSKRKLSGQLVVQKIKFKASYSKLEHIILFVFGNTIAKKVFNDSIHKEPPFPKKL